MERLRLNSTLSFEIYLHFRKTESLMLRYGNGGGGEETEGGQHTLCVCVYTIIALDRNYILYLNYRYTRNDAFGHRTNGTFGLNCGKNVCDTNLKILKRR